MKKIVIASLVLACLPYLSWAQSSDDDLYFIPKKKTEKKATITKTVKDVVPVQNNTTNVYATPGSTVVVKDVTGKVRNVDEYNRRYDSRDNNFSTYNDTLYIEEKPLDERGEWVNGFDGTQDDYEYAMRIVKFRNPRYAIPVSSPLYWDVVYGLNSWDWNVYDDGFYAYAFPTFSNRLWSDWRWNRPYGGGWGFGWSSSWYSGWYGPSWGFGWGGSWGGWYDPFWGGSWGPGWGPSWGGPCWGPGHGGGNWGRLGLYDNRRAEYRSFGNRDYGSVRESSGVRVGSSDYRQVRGGVSNRVSGRVVKEDNYGVSSVRPTRVTNQNNSINTGRSERDSPSSSSYTRPSISNRGESTYSRPSSTRSSVRDSYNNSSSIDSRRSSASDRSADYNRSNRSSSNNGSFNGGSSSRSSFSTGGGSSRISSGGGSSSSSGGGSRRR